LYNNYNFIDNNNETQFLKIKDNSSISYETFNYFENYIIGAGGNMKVFYGKELKSVQDVAVKIEYKNMKKSNAINEKYSNFIKKN
jgi:hypothetical protein